jgi:hypothetical protein
MNYISIDVKDGAWIWQTKESVNHIAGSYGILIVILAATLTIDAVQAETGKGENIFKVFMTIFEADDSRGDGRSGNYYRK